MTSTKHTAGYPPEFRAEAIRLARTSGKPNTQLAQELGMSTETQRKWLKQADLDEGKRQDGLTTDEPIERIAVCCGFSSAAILRLHFVRFLHVSPQAYRNAFHAASA